MKTYEIYNLTTEEVLADNMSFDDIPELFEAYSSFYIDCDIAVCYRTTTIKQPRQIIDIETVVKNNFKSEWLNLMEELALLGNLY